MKHEAADGPTLASYDVTTLASVSLIWCLVAFNFYVLAVRRHAQQAWNWLSLLVGYGGLALQALSFYRCRHTNPGTVTDEWVAAATAGTVPASVCPRRRYIGLQRRIHRHRSGACAGVRASGGDAARRVDA